MFSENNCHHIELDSALHIDVFGITDSYSFRLQSSRFHFGHLALQLAEFGKSGDFKCFSSIHYVREIEVNDVVSCDDVGVYFKEEVSPLLE